MHRQFTTPALFQVLYSCLLSLIASRGRSHMLIRRGASPVEEEKENVEVTNQNIRFESQSNQIEMLKNEVTKLKAELDNKSKDADLNNKNADILHKLYKSGYIDEEGNILD